MLDGRLFVAKLEKCVKGEFSNILSKIEDGILGGSLSVSLEDSSDFILGDSKCSVRVFERYSATGSNRVSLSVTLFQNKDSDIYISAISSGGSKGMFFKINTLGEGAFLDKLEEIIYDL